MAVAVVTSVVGAVGTVLGAWVQVRAQRRPRRRARLSHADSRRPSREQDQRGYRPEALPQ